MKRIMLLLTVVALMLVMLTFSAPAFADAGGVAHEGSCGLGAGRAHATIADPTSPGATELALESPVGLCTGP